MRLMVVTPLLAGAAVAQSVVPAPGTVELRGGALAARATDPAAPAPGKEQVADDGAANGAVDERTPLPEDALLDVDVVVFDPGLPDDPALYRLADVFPQVRRIESRYLAVGLRRALVRSDRFGAVRVVPKAQPSAELRITGRLLRSDGEALEVAVRAVDATGRVWLDSGYRIANDAPPLRTTTLRSGERRVPADRRAEIDEAPLEPLHERIVADLLALLDTLDASALRRVREVSRLAYAGELAPATFGRYLEVGEDGRRELRRLPARDDPRLQRVRRVRLTDDQFKDTVDTLYGRVYDEVDEAYAVWRVYRAQQEAYVEGRESRLATRQRGRGDASYASLKDSYENYRWYKLQEQTLDRLASRLDGEVSPTLTSVEGEVVELTGSIEAQYDEWRELLQRIFALEAGTGSPR